MCIYLFAGSETKSQSKKMAVQISDEQKAKYRKIFDHYDLNKDGELEADELAKASKDLGYKLSMDDIIVSGSAVPEVSALVT